MLTKLDEETAEKALSAEKASSETRLRPIEAVARRLAESLDGTVESDVFFWLMVEHLASVRAREAQARLRRAAKLKNAKDAAEEACDRCIKPIRAGELMTRTEVGRLRKGDGEFSGRYVLGCMHVDCYKVASTFREVNIERRISKARSKK